MFRRYCILVYFMISQFCFSEELTREQLIQGVNMSRELIANGEMRVIVTRHYPAKKSPEEIQAWIVAEKKKILREYSDTSQEERQAQLDSVGFDAMWYEERQEIEEIEVIFRILDHRSLSYPAAYQYKMTIVDRREEIPPYSNQLGYFQVLAYDGQTQAHEEVERFSAPSIAFFKKDYYAGFIHFQVYGRSHAQVPFNAKLVGRETIAGTDCYVLEFKEVVTGNPKKIWVDVQKQFCIRKGKGIDQRRQLPVTWESVYEDFQLYGDIWFPAVSRWTAKQDGKVKQVNTMVVKEAQFNLSFPTDFFQINPRSYLEQGLTPRIDSKISLGSLGGTLLKHPALPNESASLDKSSTAPDPLLLTCGPNSLLRICELLTVNTNFDELAQLSRFDPNQGTTLLGLRDAAKYKGLNPQGIKSNLKLLKKNDVPLPAIAYVGGNHFLVFEKVVPHGVLISDPADKYDHYLSFKELSKIWNGELLIFDYQPELADPKPMPRVLAEAGFYDFGEALGGSEIKHTFRLKNIGQKSLKIERVEQSCACTATLVSKDEIPPGQFGIVEAVLKVPSENRQVEESINVYTNDPVQNRVTLILKGSAFVPITTFPSRLLLGSIQSKTPITKSLTVHQKGETRILGVRTDSDHLKATVVSAKADQITKVEVALLESAPVGPFSHNLLVGYQYEGKEATHEVMVFGEVLGAFTVSPKRFFFGLVEDKQAVSKTISISSLNDQPFKIASVESNSAYVTTKVASQGAGVGYQLTATVQPEAPAGELSGEILVKTNNIVQPVIRVPFSGIIPSKK